MHKKPFRHDGTRAWIREKQQETEKVLNEVFKTPCPTCGSNAIRAYPPIATRWEAPREEGWQCLKCGHIFGIHSTVH